MAKAIHTMIRVLDLDRSIDFYGRAFGLEPADHFDFEGFALVYLRNHENDFEIELTWNADQAEPYSHGSGYGHVAVCVDDAKAEQNEARVTVGAALSNFRFQRRRCDGGTGGRGFGLPGRPGKRRWPVLGSGLDRRPSFSFFLAWGEEANL